ncbi:MAG: DUF2510 domain-containing protein [Actinomycetota bacterium]|nr:DUF2510 domain-containing protein [Actinomycetota bacterium]
MAAGWHPDPFGRWEQRYWDGTQWTQHVSTAGQSGVDPAVPAPPAVQAVQAVQVAPAAPAATQWGAPAPAVPAAPASVAPPMIEPLAHYGPAPKGGGSAKWIALVAVLAVAGVIAFVVASGDDGDGDIATPGSKAGQLLSKVDQIVDASGSKDNDDEDVPLGRCPFSADKYFATLMPDSGSGSGQRSAEVFVNEFFEGMTCKFDTDDYEEDGVELIAARKMGGGLDRVVEIADAREEFADGEILSYCNQDDCGAVWFSGDLAVGFEYDDGQPAFDHPVPAEWLKQHLSALVADMAAANVDLTVVSST